MSKKHSSQGYGKNIKRNLPTIQLADTWVYLKGIAPSFSKNPEKISVSQVQTSV